MSYNRPSFNAYSAWSANAITFANRTTISSHPHDIFIDRNNTVYVIDSTNHRIQIWFENSSIPEKTIFDDLLIPYSIFVDINSDIYVSYNFDPVGRVEKRSYDTNDSAVMMNTSDICDDLFVDVNNVLYCSIYNDHKVVTQSMDTSSDVVTVVAGTGCGGSTSNQLLHPRGIYVDTNLDLYVADSGNNRIQRFRPNRLDAETIEIKGRMGTIQLNEPSAVVLDADRRLFIVDLKNNRIIGSGPDNSFRCIIGCYGNGSASNQLSGPINMAFDRHGNIFVVDKNNHRIQKFPLLDINLSKCDNCQ